MKDTARIFKALSDETRLRILSLLSVGKELCVCDLMAVMEMPQSTVSRHLAYLRNANLVNDRRQGIWMHYKTANSHGLVKNLLNALALHSRGNQQVASDRQKLASYLKSKDSETCG